jgi:hypothetical protein
MKGMASTCVTMALTMALVFALFTATLSADVARMTKDELKTLIEKGQVNVVDVRSGRDWKSSEYKIHKAVREDPSQVASWADKYAKDKALVLYCA